MMEEYFVLGLSIQGRDGSLADSAVSVGVPVGAPGQAALLQVPLRRRPVLLHRSRRPPARGPNASYHGIGVIRQLQRVHTAAEEVWQLHGYRPQLLELLALPLPLLAGTVLTIGRQGSQYEWRV